MTNLGVYIVPQMDMSFFTTTPGVMTQVLSPLEWEYTWIKDQVFCPFTVSLEPWNSSTELRPYLLSHYMLDFYLGSSAEVIKVWLKSSERLWSELLALILLRLLSSFPSFSKVKRGSWALDATSCTRLCFLWLLSTWCLSARLLDICAALSLFLCSI